MEIFNGHKVNLISRSPYQKAVEAAKVHNIENLSLYERPGFSLDGRI